MEDSRSNVNIRGRHDQLLFIECELWRLHTTENHLVPIVNGDLDKTQLQLNPRTPLDMLEESYFGNLKYFVEITLFFIDSSAIKLSSSKGYTALVSTEFLSPQSFYYSRSCVDSKSFHKRMEKQSIIDLEKVYILISNFLSCCRDRDCGCYLNSLKSNSCIVTWDPMKVQSLLNINVSNNSFSHKNICQNNLFYKLSNIISLSGMVRSYLPSYPVIESCNSIEVFNQVKYIALSLGVSNEDLIIPINLDLNSPLGGYTELFCRYMAKIALTITRKFHLSIFDRNCNFEYDRIDYPEFLTAQNDCKSICCKNTCIKPVIRLRGLPWKAEIKDIIVFLNPVCDVSYSNIAISYNNEGRMTGEAYVVLPSIQAYEACLTFLHGKKMGKRWIEVLPSSLKEFVFCKQMAHCRKQEFSRINNDLINRFCNRSILKLRGLPWTITEYEIAQFFLSSGITDINTCDIFLGLTETQRLSGEAWIALPLWCDANEVKRILNRKIIGKRYIEVFISSVQELSRVKSTFTYRQQNKEIGNTTILRIRGLPYTATESDLISFFSEFKITGIVPIINNKADGRPSGQVLVKFSSADEAINAYKSKNMGLIHNRYIELFPVRENDFLCTINRLQKRNPINQNFYSHKSTSSVNESTVDGASDPFPNNINSK